MEIVDLLATFADPSTIKNLTTSQRLYAGLITTLLGMGITFLALVILQLVTTLLGKLGTIENTWLKPAQQTEPTSDESDAELTRQNDEELVSAITASVAVLLETSASNIIIRNIRRLEDTSPAWSKAGIAEQMHNKV